jgi:hypothetical protein
VEADEGERRKGGELEYELQGLARGDGSAHWLSARPAAADTAQAARRAHHRVSRVGVPGIDVGS